MLRRLRPVAFGVLSVLFFNRYGWAASNIEFNTDVLDVKERSQIDLSQFSQAGYVMPGDYQMVIRINKNEIPEQTISFFAPDDNPKGSAACLTPDMIKQLGLKVDSEKSLRWWHNNQCLDVTSLSGAEERADLGEGALYISMPQAYLEYTAENWDPPARWDNGIPGIIADYNVNATSTHQSQQGNDKDMSGNGVVGMNLGPWRLRADWQAQYEKSAGEPAQKDWTWSRYYLYRAISSLRAKLMVGEDYLRSDLFDSFRFTGGGLTSEDDMLPPNLRGYAPEVTGVAKTNAKVTISQQGRVIYETMVAAGPFRIQDLNTAVTGKLDVKIKEQDGSEQTFQIDTANIPYLTRPGRVRYKVFIGKPSDIDHHTQGPDFTSGEFSWGINSGWSLYGGSLLAGDYNALALGIGRDLLMLGAISFDVTQSRAKIPESSTKKGGSYRVSYSKRFDRYDSQITFAGYRFSERNFMTMSQYLDARYHDASNIGSGKELYTVTFNKQFRELNLSAYVNYSHQTYWNQSSSDTWNLSLSDSFDLGRFKNVNLSLSAYRSEYEGIKDDGMYVGLSLPWGNSGTIDYNGQFNRGKSTHSASIYDRIDDNNSYRLRAGMSNDGTSSGSGYITHEGDLAEVDANVSYSGSDYSAEGITVQGGLTATAHGVALHRAGTVGGTRMLVDTDGVSGVPIRGNSGLTYTNVFGKAVIADISDYYRNSINVDLDHLPNNIDATRSVVQGTLTEGAIGYRKFGVVAGLKAMAVIKLADGSVPPFGAIIINENESRTGIVNEDGDVWLTGINPGETMSVSWNGAAQCHIVIPKKLPQEITSTLLLPCER